MQKFFVNEDNIDKVNNLITIEGEDVNHIKNVLRYEKGENIEICEKSNNPSKYKCSIIQLNQKQIICKILEEIENSNEANIRIHIMQGIPKAEKMEFIIQKCTELGVYKFIPVNMKRCVVKLNSKDEDKKIARWQKIAEVAAKQCGRDIIPTVTKIVDIKDIANQIKNYDLVLIAYENEKENFLKYEIKDIINKQGIKDIAILIGTEGGLEEQEILLLREAGAKIISLGKRILRTETAPIVISGIVMYEIGDIGG